MEEKTNGKTKATPEIKEEACSTVRYAVRKDRLYLRLENPRGAMVHLCPFQGLLSQSLGRLWKYPE